MVDTMINMTTTVVALHDDTEERDYIPMTLPVLIVSGILITVVIVLAVVGNALTMVSYLKDDGLNSVYDFFIFNLAIADFLLGCVSLPFYAVYTLMETRWIFGRLLCKIWKVIDFTCCLESVLLMLVLSLDRLLLISYGPFYTTKVTKLKAYIASVCSWLLAFLVYGPSIIGWEYWVGSSVKDNDCDVDFAHNFEFTIVTAFIEFTIPLIILAVLNLLIYLKIRKKVKRTLSMRASSLPAVVDQLQITVGTSSTDSPEASTCETNAIQTETTNVSASDDGLKHTEGERNKPYAQTDIAEDNITPAIAENIHEENITRREDSITSRRNRNVKAAKFLASLVIVFFICWAPYTVTTIYISFCKDACVHGGLYVILNWMLYGKSAVNPCLYAANSTRYRYNFRKYLSCLRIGFSPNDR